jgi:hypothetical protein
MFLQMGLDRKTDQPSDLPGRRSWWLRLTATASRRSKLVMNSAHSNPGLRFASSGLLVVSRNASTKPPKACSPRVLAARMKRSAIRDEMSAGLGTSCAVPLYRLGSLDSIYPTG